jgi:hypothetical protein
MRCGGMMRRTMFVVYLVGIMAGLTFFIVVGLLRL